MLTCECCGADETSNGGLLCFTVACERCEYTVCEVCLEDEQRTHCRCENRQGKDLPCTGAAHAHRRMLTCECCGADETSNGGLLCFTVPCETCEYTVCEVCLEDERCTHCRCETRQPKGSSTTGAANASAAMLACEYCGADETSNGGRLCFAVTCGACEYTVCEVCLEDEHRTHCRCETRQGEGPPRAGAGHTHRRMLTCRCCGADETSGSGLLCFTVTCGACGYTVCELCFEDAQGAHCSCDPRQLERTSRTGAARTHGGARLRALPAAGSKARKLLCSSCFEARTRHAFTNLQLSKRDGRRCKACVRAEAERDDVARSMPPAAAEAPCGSASPASAAAAPSAASAPDPSVPSASTTSAGTHSSGVTQRSGRRTEGGGHDGISGRTPTAPRAAKERQARRLCRRAVEVGVLTEARMHTLTDAMAAGATTPAALMAEWQPIVDAEKLFRPARLLLAEAEAAAAGGDVASALRLGYAAVQHAQTRGADPGNPPAIRARYALSEAEAGRAFVVFGRAHAALGREAPAHMEKVNFDLGLTGSGPNACRDRFSPDGSRLTQEAGEANLSTNAEVLRSIGVETEPEAAGLRPGAALSIRGVRSRPELNGASAVVLQRHAETKRVAVRVTSLADGSAPEREVRVSVKHECCVLARDAEAPPAEADAAADALEAMSVRVPEAVQA